MGPRRGLRGGGHLRGALTRSRSAFYAPLLVACAVLIACGGGRSEQRDAATSDGATTAGEIAPHDSSGAAPTVPPNDAAGGSTSGRNVDSLVAAIQSCPRDGRWHPCSIERRLQMAGLRPVRSDTLTPIPSLSGEQMAWQVGRQSLRAHLFRSAREADEAFATLDSATAAPTGDLTTFWPDRPTLLRSANGVFLYLGGSDRQVIRVSDAIMAGPPQKEQ